MPANAVARRLLGRLAPLVAAAAIVLRWLAAGETGAGANLVVDLLVWVALAAWFAARALEGGAAWRFTGVEFGLLAFVIAALVSVLRASCKLAAIDQAMGFLACALMFVLIVNSLGRATLLRLLSSTAFALGVCALFQYLVIFPQTRAEYPGLQIDVSRRLEAREVMATFFYPNTFGGFLALALPFLAGSLLDARAAGARALWPLAAAAGIAAVAMVLTGSTGAWAALGIGAAAFAARWATRRRGRSWAVAAGLAAALLGAAAIAAALPRLAERSPSLRNRQAYWTAAVRIFKTAPVLGVGLDQYQDCYPEHKPETPQETRKAHNDYLQIPAETGLAGLLAFLAVLALGLRPALAREEAAPAGGDDPPSGQVAVAGAAAFLMASLVADTLPLLTAFVAGAAWLAHFFFWRPPAGPLPFTRIGLAAGLAALLAHMAVDFDLGDRGVAMTLFFALALAAVLRGPRAEVRLPAPACAAAAGTLVLVSLPLALVAAPRLIAADAAIEGASAALGRFERRPLKDRSLDDALRLSETAREENPLDPEGYLLYARAQFHYWDLLRRGRPAGEERLRELQEKEHVVLLAIDDALRLRPRDVGFHRAKVECLREFRRFYIEWAAGLPSRRDPFAALAASHLDSAVEHQRRALRLYPTLALNSFAMARLLDLRGEGGEALGHYREALRLHGLAAAEKWGTGRLELPPRSLARALKRRARLFEAHGTVVACLRRRVEGLDPEDARRELERLKRSPEILGGSRDEADDLIRPVIGDAADSILKGLPK